MSATSAYHQEGLFCYGGNKYLLLAIIAADRCNPSEFSLDAYTAQIMAAVSAEAFVDEFAFKLSILNQAGKVSDLARLGAILQQLEDSRVQVTEKYRIASQLLPGDPFEPGRQPFQSFNQLIKLRNFLAHPKVLDKPPNWFSYFASNGLLVQQADASVILPDWATQLQSKNCARWACRAAARIILALIDRVREPSVTEGVPGVYETLHAMWNLFGNDTRIWSGQPSDNL